MLGAVLPSVIMLNDAEYTECLETIQPTESLTPDIGEAKKYLC